MVSYCSLSNDRSLINLLIEYSHHDQIENNSHFNNKRDWCDGLNLWSIQESTKKYSSSKSSLHFDDQIGLYLPKLTNQFVPSKQNSLSKKDSTDLDLSSSEKCLSISNEQISFREENQSASQRIEQKSRVEGRVRYPLRHIGSRIYPNEEQLKKENQKLNREKFQNLLKEQITNIFSRETNQKRTFIQIPSVQIKHQNIQSKSNTQTDPNLIIERYQKLQQLLISPIPTQPTIQQKSIDFRQSPILFQGISSFGLTVTPLDFSSSKQLLNSSLDKTLTDRNSSPTNRPSVSMTTEQSDDQQNILLKRRFETNLSPSTNILTSSQTNPHTTNEQLEFIRKYTRQHRPFPKHTFTRSKTFQFLPFIHGKKIDVNSTNQNKD